MRSLHFTLISFLAGFTMLRAEKPSAPGDWAQWLGPQGDSSWKATGLVDKFPAAGPKILWRSPVANGYSGPSVSGGKVYVMDFEVKNGTVDANPGARTTVSGKERLLCLDEASGKQLWVHAYDCTLNLSFPNGPRCSPVIAGGIVYALGGGGQLTAVDAATGKLVWEKNLATEYKTEAPIWGYSSTPLIKDGRLYTLCGGAGSQAVALEAATGKEIWRALSGKDIGYAPPVLWNHAGKEELLIWLPDALHGLDPVTGKVAWSQKLDIIYGMSIMAPRVEGDRIFVGGMGKKSMMVKPGSGSVEILWEGAPNQSIHPKNGTPVIVDGVIYGCDMDGDLLAVKASDGTRLWKSTAIMSNKKSSSGTFFMARTGQYYVIFNDSGELILARLTPEKYEEISRAKILEATSPGMGRKVVWSHPAFAGQCVYARNDKEIICVSLAGE